MKTEILRKKQVGHKIRLLRWTQEIRQLCSDNASRSKVRIALKELEKQFEKLRLLQEELEEGLSLNDLEKEIDEFGTLENEILEIRCIAEDFIENQTDEKRTETMKNGIDASVNVRLPRYELPKFKGDVLEFTSFWEQFEDSIHSRQDISDSAKFSYLRSCLSGSALAAVNGLSLTAANYFAAIEILKNRFGRKDVVIQNHIRKLLEVEPCVKPSAENLQHLHDHLNLHVRALGALGKDLTSSQLTVAEVMMELFKLKLPIEIRKKWEEEYFVDMSKSSDLTSFFAFLQKQVRIEQSVVVTPKSESVRISKEKEANVDAGKIWTTASLNAKIEPRMNSCAICDGAHSIFHCQIFMEAKSEERRKWCEKRCLCFCCLHKGHPVKWCTRKKQCGEAGCTENHHRLLHQSGTTENLEPETDQIYDEGDKVRESSEATDNAVLLAKSLTGKNILLQTADAFIENEDGERQLVMCLLDSGCQQSLIRKNIAEQIGLKGHTERVKITRLGDSCGQYEKTQRIKFCLKNANNKSESVSMEALCVPTICELPANPKLNAWKHLENVELADKFPRPAVEIDVLIGMDFYYEFMSNEILKGDEKEPYVINSRLGWILAGPIPTITTEENETMLLSKFENEATSFWKNSITYDGDRKTSKRSQEMGKVVSRSKDTATLYEPILKENLGNGIDEVRW
ncbi:hypothetical protein T10_4990 [Trichinella papuae]|uniref:DUF1758 domain-containing protein n=1 Tax=Trichinella papuae TaxID=268474 RepID=A0A0V1MKP8_9BILA|nr:hypothetical protein T10_4990 [Trichinella papuae]